MTAREWTIVALRALLSIVMAVFAVAGLNQGAWFAGFLWGLASVCVGLIAFARYHDLRWRAQLRRYADE